MVFVTLSKIGTSTLEIGVGPEVDPCGTLTRCYIQEIREFIHDVKRQMTVLKKTYINCQNRELIGPFTHAESRAFLRLTSTRYIPKLAAYTHIYS